MPIVRPMRPLRPRGPHDLVPSCEISLLIKSLRRLFPLKVSVPLPLLRIDPQADVQQILARDQSDRSAAGIKHAGGYLARPIYFLLALPAFAVFATFFAAGAFFAFFV
jgi:hypothetical protein